MSLRDLQGIRPQRRQRRRQMWRRGFSRRLRPQRHSPFSAMSCCTATAETGFARATAQEKRLLRRADERRARRAKASSILHEHEHRQDGSRGSPRGRPAAGSGCPQQRSVGTRHRLHDAALVRGRGRAAVCPRAHGRRRLRRRRSWNVASAVRAGRGRPRRVQVAMIWRPGLRSHARRPAAPPVLGHGSRSGRDPRSGSRADKSPAVWSATPPRPVASRRISCAPPRASFRRSAASSRSP